MLRRLLGVLAWSAWLACGCATVVSDLEGRPCADGLCAPGFECHPFSAVCVPQAQRGCDPGELCWENIRAGDRCAPEGIFVPCAAVADCSLGCRTCDAGVWSTCEPSCAAGADGDGDGYPAARCGGTDCNDADPNIHPDASELCADGIDNDCNSVTDCADAGCAGDLVCQCESNADQDGDGHASIPCGGADCDDTDSLVFPGTMEVCGDGIDNNCDSRVDCSDATCSAALVCVGPNLVRLPVFDTYVAQSAPEDNFGTRPELEIDGPPGTKRVFIRPDLSALAMPADAVIVSAVLVVRVFNRGDALAVRRITAPWDETTVRWDDEIPVNAAAEATLLTVEGTQRIAITELFSAWVAGTLATHGVALEATGSDEVKLRSREFTNAAHHPYFEVLYL